MLKSYNIKIIKHTVDFLTNSILTFVFLSILFLSSISVYTFSPKSEDELIPKKDEKILGIDTITKKTKEFEEISLSSNTNSETFVGESGSITRIFVVDSKLSSFEEKYVRITNIGNFERKYKISLKGEIDNIQNIKLVGGENEVEFIAEKGEYFNTLKLSPNKSVDIGLKFLDVEYLEKLEIELDIQTIQ